MDEYLRRVVDDELDELITARLPLARINDGFDAMRRGQAIRTVVQPWDAAVAPWRLWKRYHRAVACRRLPEWCVRM